MERLDSKTHGRTVDIVQQNVAKLKEIFPEVFSEGKVDLDALRETLGVFVDDRQERYSFTWNGKSRARKVAQTPSTGTLRPCPEASIHWDQTHNLFVEGDNLEVLKLLQKSYHRQVKLIYIDPPYNTGNEFIYPDDYQDNLETYLKYTGQVDAQGLRFSSNTEESGRYHTNWLNMMWPRLQLARNLLRDDGVIFISIDDHEVRNLRHLCDEIFGEENFITTAIWQKVYSPKNSARHFSEDHDYVVIYARNATVWTPTLLPRTQEANARYGNPDNDPRGPWKASDLTARNYYSEGQYEVTGPTGRRFRPGKGRFWLVSQENLYKMDADKRIWWGPTGDSMPAQKRFLSEVKQGIVPQTLWPYSLVGHTQEAKKELLEYVEFEHTENVLNSVKPSKFLRHILKVATTPHGNDLILDFFSGSASMGHAVYLQNQEDGGNRRFILVQLPEPLPKEEATIRTIADLGKSRLRNVGRAVQGTLAVGEVTDLGFKVFKLDSTNLKPWDPDLEDLEPSLLDALESIKPDRTEADVLYEVLLKYGLDLAIPVEARQIEGRTVYVVGTGALVVCLATDIDLKVVESIAALKAELSPEVMRVVFRDAGFENDVVKTNAVQILRQAGLNDEDIKSL